MAKYLAQINYVGEGVEGLMKDGGSRRREVSQKAAESVGGKLEFFYYALGEVDAFAVVDFPDAASAVALSMMINASGAVTVNITPLLTPEEMDEAAKKTPSYSPPGQ